MSRDEAIAVIRSIERTCRGPRPSWVEPEIVRLLEEGKLEEAGALDSATRPGCGYDFNDIVVAGPWDGEEHDYVCPLCGVSGTYRAPWLEVEEFEIEESEVEESE